MNVSKLSLFFYSGLFLAAFLAALAPFISKLPGGGSLMMVTLIVFGHAHFLVAYLYYIDILRITFSGNRRKLFLYLASFIATVLVFYFAKYVWFVSFASIFSLIVFAVFISHHVENMFVIGEDFHQDFKRNKRSYTNFWLVIYFVALFMSFMTYGYYVIENGVVDTIFTLWVFLIPLAILFFSVSKLYFKAINRKLLLLLPILGIFCSPYILQNVSFGTFSIFAMYWHFLAWFILYAFVLLLRDSRGAPKKISELPISKISSFLRKTRSGIWNYLMFQIFIMALVAFLYVLTAKIQGFPPLSGDMVNDGFFWGWKYFEMWTFAHIIFTLLPKGIKSESQSTG